MKGRKFNPSRNCEYLGTASKAASLRRDNDDDYRERIPTYGKNTATLPQVMHKAGQLGLYIKTAAGQHRGHIRRYRICEEYPAISKKNHRGTWVIVEPARTIRHHKEAWISLQMAWEYLMDLDTQWNPPTQHLQDIYQTRNQTSI